MPEVRVPSVIVGAEKLAWPQRCARKSCAAMADWQIGFRLTAAGDLPVLDGVSVVDQWLSNGVCDIHREEITISIVLPPANQEAYLAALLAMGYDLAEDVEVSLILRPLVSGSA